MPAQPWVSDLDRVKRELTQRIDRMEAAANSASRGSSNDQAREMTARERRLDAVERRVQTTVDAPTAPSPARIRPTSG